MAGNSKVTFRLSELVSQALVVVTQRVTAQEKVLAEAEAHEASLPDRLIEWREAQQARLDTLEVEFGTMTSEEIAAWRFEAPPAADPWAVGRARSDLSRLLDAAEQVKAKGASLSPDASGNVSLTRAQLSEFFGL